ncbi:MAG: ribose-phosphate diphosphokinase [Candidatus Pacebacteria bacterium]|nr:ribose-phosphate diphosphokinase [Candidatus Paceibacterota bacterium]MCF7862887.1 ribose-phosphate diphosphokinase [Candidatus Paceibacterota bacterium]
MKNNNHINVNPYPLRIYSLSNGTHTNLAEKISKLLKTPISPVLYKSFKNGEFLIHHTESVRDRDVYVICQPRYGSKEELAYDLDECVSLIFGLKQGEPSRITVIMPCLPYARQDRSTNHREPVLSQKVPMQLQMAGANRIVVLKLHNPSSYNAHSMSIPIVDVDTTDLLLTQIRKKKFDLDKVMIVSPDLGAAPSTRKIAGALGIPGNIVILNKLRDYKKSNHNQIMEVIGDPKGYICIMPDDIADTCGTAVNCLKALKENGAKEVYFTATHAILSGDALDNLNNAEFSGVWLTDSCLDQEKIKKLKNLEVISTSKLIAQVIDNLHNGNSVTALWHSEK